MNKNALVSKNTNFHNENQSVITRSINNEVLEFEGLVINKIIIKKTYMACN